MLMDQARAQRMQPVPQDATAPAGQSPTEPDEAQASEGGGDFQMPDWRAFTPPEQMDAVERILAAGVKTMYAPAMRDELKQAVQSDAPMPQKLAENTAGLLLTLDKQSKGGIPIPALFPAAMALLGEAAEVVKAAGQDVGQEDFNDAALLLYALLGKKLGASDEQLMQSATQMAGQGGQAPQAAPQPAAAPTPAEDEMAGMARGMQR